MNRIIAFALAAMLAAVAASCVDSPAPPARQPAPVAASAPTNTPAPVPTSTPAPTYSPTPSPTATATYTPTHTPAPTATQSPTPSPSATATYTPILTPTPAPTYTPTPTATHTPAPTFTPTITPTYAPTPTPTATPTPAPVPTATYTPTPAPTPTPRYQIETRDQKYAHEIAIPDGWRKYSPDCYERDAPDTLWATLCVQSVALADGTSLETFAERVRDNLEHDWRASHDWRGRLSLFETTSFRKGRVDGLPVYYIAYRVQEDTRFCVIDGVEMVAAASLIPGVSGGFRVEYETCGEEAHLLRESRNRTLASFRAVARPSAYYTRFIRTDEGATVKAADEAAPTALSAAADTVSGMMANLRDDMRACLVRRGAAVAIYPEGEYVVALPEFAHLKGETSPLGAPYDLFDSGLADGSRAIAAIGELHALRLGEPGLSPTVAHEFAHLIQDTCFTPQDDDEWDALWSDAVRADALPGAYARTNKEEFFAELSMSYFGFAIDAGPRAPASAAPKQYKTRAALEPALPGVFDFMERVYGEVETAAADSP